MRALNTLKSTVTNPRMAKRVAQFVVNDLNSLFGRHHYQSRIIFIAGMPKSGTTWLSSMLSHIPGYNLRPIRDPGQTTIQHNICDAVFTSLPTYGYSVVKLHTKYTPDNYRIITRYTDKFIVMYRDLRDMCVSRYFHVRADITHRHHKLYQDMSLEDGLSHSISMLSEHYVEWMRGWYEQIAKVPDVIMPVRYEDLNLHTGETLQRVTEFFRIPIGHDTLDKLAKTKLQNKESLGPTFNQNKSQLIRSTARKGAIGEWRECFSPEHLRKIKAVAGEVLIMTGYESTSDWDCIT